MGKSSVVLRFCQNDFQANKEPTIGGHARIAFLLRFQEDCSDFGFVLLQALLS